MRRAFAMVRSGAWLTPARIRLWTAAVLIASLAGLLYLLVSSDGLRDSFGRPLGTDFSNIYAAGTFVLEGRPAAPFDPPTQHAREQAIFGADTPFYGWHYPPFFLFVAGALALLPYALALALWQAATFALYLGAIWLVLHGDAGLWRSPATAGERQSGNARARRDSVWLLVAATFPAAFVNLTHGHNGFLTAALLGTALAVLDRRPTLAGVLIGLLAYKPQFGVLIPLVLAASGRWRTFGAAAATVAALCLFVTLAFGAPAWEAFFASTSYTRTVVLEAGGTGWEKIQSVFSAIRMWGGSVALAYAGQAAVTAALAVALVRLWRSEAAFAPKAAALVIGSVLATPYALDYDLMALAPAIAFLARDGLNRGFAPFEKSLLAATWLAPLLARSVAQHAFLPVAVILMLALFALVCRKAGGDAALRADAMQPAG